MIWLTSASPALIVNLLTNFQNAFGIARTRLFAISNGNALATLPFDLPYQQKLKRMLLYSQEHA